MVVVLMTRIPGAAGCVVVEELDLMFARARESMHCGKDLRNSKERTLAVEEVWIVRSGDPGFRLLRWGSESRGSGD
jgi:hypothetical protein